jgi:formyltetrahydrofolate-dependent phosphoribosylglycinamide formyltransferase
MFDRLQKKWKVSGPQLILILCTFAIGGSLTGFLGKKIMNFLHVEQDWLWAIIYILLVTIIWPMAVLLVSIPFGKFRFFTNYIRKMGGKMGFSRQKAGKALKNEIVHITIFASGNGSNAQQIIDHFRSHSYIKIVLVVSNNPKAAVLDISRQEQIPFLIVEKEKFTTGDAYLHQLIEKKTDIIILAGFLWKLPASLVNAYRDHIINIHPALLPKYGGEGMYGRYVHQAVLDNKEKETGITIHLVDEIYDHGKIIFQARCPVMENDTAITLAKRVQQLEHEHYPKVIEQVLLNPA